MKRKTEILAIVVIMAGVRLSACLRANEFSIYEIQYTMDPNGSSPLAGQVIDCAGGIVTHKFGGSKPKLTIQDPDFPLGWAAIQVKDWLNGAPLFARASVGDWVKLSNVYVEEFRGNTTLQCLASDDPNLTVVSNGNPLPEPRLVGLDEISSPIMDSYGDWYVRDHGAEKYEHMWIKLWKVVVTEVGHGKAGDNYVLQDFTNPDNPNLNCWAADYMNEDKPTDQDYHPYVAIGASFCSVEGILEQYTKVSDGWDYYQLVTTRSEDFIITQVADFDDDCDVDFYDFGYFAQHWSAEGNYCESEPCSAASLTKDGADGMVDSYDLFEFAQHWLEGKW
jgi:hypothetical protein